ncbi:MAG TPA: hypothetical protein VMB80_14860 [Candidatus Acidoferrum sp.]|nr:hypothetical protein [Candidatus Acidoferrum sp.]
MSPMPFFSTPDAKTVDAGDSAWLKPGWFAALLAVLTLAAYPQVFLGFQTFVYRDFGLFSYPIAYHWRESFWRGELPLWNPLNNCGTPFLAQWNTQVLYPPALFYLLLPLSWSLGVFCLLHLFWGGLGMFFLARQWTQNSPAAAFAGIVFAFNGLMLSSLIWPATIAGLGWMPWVVWLTERAGREGGRMLIVAALTGALQMLSGGTEVVLLTWVWLGASTLLACAGGDGRGWQIFWRTGLIVLLISGLAAAQLLPFFDLLDHSRRQQEISATLWPMPLTGWANFFVPLFRCRSYQGVFMQDGQSWTNSYYVGVATVMLALVTLWRVRQRRIWLPTALIGLSLILALGEATPVYNWAARHVSAIGLMRFPIKFVILPVFLLPLLAAQGLAQMPMEAGSRTGGRRGRAALVWLGAIALVLGILWWQWSSGSPGDNRMAILGNGLARAAFFTAVAGGWWFAGRISSRSPRRWWQLLLLLLVWLDLTQDAPRPQTVNRSIYEPGLSRPLPAPRFGEGRMLVPGATSLELGHMFLADVTKDYLGRRFMLSSDCNLLDHLPNCDGFFPLCLGRFAALFYNYAKDSTAAPLLDFLGVSQILAVQTNNCEWIPRTGALPLLTGGQKPQFTDDLAAIQSLTNGDFNPRREVCLPEAAKPFIAASNATPVTISPLKFSANRIEAEAETAAPALLVAAQIYYHPWHAYVDGRPARLWPANYAFQAFEIPPGTHHVKLVYEDRRFQLGAVISLATLAGCLLAFIRPRRQPAQGLASRV